MKKNLSKLLKCLLPAVLLVVMLISALPAIPASAAPSSQQSHAGALETAISIYGASRYAFQTFTANSSYVLSSFRPRVYRTGSPGPITATLYRVNPQSPGIYMGSALASGNVSGDSLPTTEGTSIYFEIGISEFYIQEGDTYAIVLSGGVDSANKITLLANNDGFAGGYCYYTTNNGGSWVQGEGANDMLFQVWGEVLDTYPVLTSDTPTSITDTSADLQGILSDLGNGATSANVSFEWDYYVSSGDPSFTTDPENLGEAGTFDAGISLPIGGRPYYFRAKATNDLGKTTYGNTVIFNSVPSLLP